MKLFSKRKKAKISVCTNNIDRFYSDEQLERLEDFAVHHNIDVQEMECLSYCDECAVKPYVLKNRKLIDADTPEELLEKMSAYLDQPN
ncbi:DUF1450 domain-containing protein [Fervidibacillus halotolerans]|uniref:YuzB family protein n=1 Tax=Fervidibacillus halotolerans TaxID=2980027 RepID=A0A9E8LY66_9BACI|nr:DUF1450 domain-containing protein [Fervidibacillus halotolerans]WAA11923.1 YuzB family protein [Fervidibacillus halotolerans]